MVDVTGAIGTVVAVYVLAYKSVSRSIWRRRAECRFPGGHTGVTFVGVDLWGALGEPDVGLVGHLVKGILAAGEQFAGIAMARGLLLAGDFRGRDEFEVGRNGWRGNIPEDVGIAVNLGGPLSLATVAASVVGSHGDAGCVESLEERGSISIEVVSKISVQKVGHKRIYMNDILALDAMTTHPTSRYPPRPLAPPPLEALQSRRPEPTVIHVQQSE